MLPPPWPSFLHKEEGGVAIMAAAFGVLLCGFAALAVDVGSIALTARRVQGTADLAALTAARDLNRAEAAARATARANLPQLDSYVVRKGRYVPDASKAPKERFKVQGADANAAQVELTAPARLYFAKWIFKKDVVMVTRQATAALPGGQSRAMFSIGSRLASLDEGLANALLSGLLGSNVSLKLMDYRTLADAQVNLLQFSDTLAANVGVTAGDYDALLKQEVTTGQVLKALELVASADSRSVLSQLTHLPLTTKLKLQDLIGVEADARQGLKRGLDANVSALDILMASLETANGDRQIALDAGARTGLADLDIILAIGERPNKSPWLTVTAKGDPIIRTAQTRIYLKATTAQALSGLAQVKLPILVEVASAEAHLSDIQCSASPTARLAVRPGIAHARIGTIDEAKLKNFKSELKTEEATLVSALAGTVKVMAKADLKVADQTWQTVNFTHAEAKAGQIKSVRSQAFINGLIVSLLRDVDARVDLIGLPLISVGGVLNALGLLLTPLGPVLDGVVQPLLTLLGVKLGEADVQMHAIECPQTGKGPVLVG